MSVMRSSGTQLVCGDVAPSPRASCLRGEAGFNILELLVVVAILVLLGGITLPSALEAGRQQRLNTSASMIAAKLNEARMNSLKRNRPTWLLIEAEARRVVVQTLGADGEAEDLGTPALLSTGVTFGETPEEITYDAMGRTTVVQTIGLTAGESTRTVRVRLTGAATIE